MTDFNALLKRSSTLCTELTKQSLLYYEGGASISDQTFDKMLTLLEEDMIRLKDQLCWEKPNVEERSMIRKITKFLNSVGAEEPIKELYKNKHLCPMKSIKSVYSWGLVEQFINKVNSLGGEGVGFVCEPKIDGMAFSAVYENGVLLHVSSRGDGVYGFDLTTKVRAKHVLPETIKTLSKVEIIGELFIPNNINVENKRNVISGCLMSKQETPPEYPIMYKAFSINGNVEKNTQLGIITTLNELGIFTPQNIYTQSLSSIKEFHNVWDTQFGEFETDGIVVKVNDIELQREMGSTNKYPSWCLAFKHEFPSAITKVVGIQHKTGVTGRITPIVFFEEVKLSGATLRKASLYSVLNLNKLGIKIGSKIEVRRVGGTIPKVIRVL